MVERVPEVQHGHVSIVRRGDQPGRQLKGGHSRVLRGGRGGGNLPGDHFPDVVVALVHMGHRRRG